MCLIISENIATLIANIFFPEEKLLLPYRPSVLNNLYLWDFHKIATFLNGNFCWFLTKPINSFRKQRENLIREGNI